VGQFGYFFGFRYGNGMPRGLQAHQRVDLTTFEAAEKKQLQPRRPSVWQLLSGANTEPTTLTSTGVFSAAKV